MGRRRWANVRLLLALRCMARPICAHNTWFLLTYDDRFYLHTTNLTTEINVQVFTYIRRLFLLTYGIFFTYILGYSSKLKELMPQIRVTSYAFIDVNNKIGLHIEKQRQIILISVKALIGIAY